MNDGQNLYSGHLMKKAQRWVMEMIMNGNYVLAYQDEKEGESPALRSLAAFLLLFFFVVIGFLLPK